MSTATETFRDLTDDLEHGTVGQENKALRDLLCDLVAKLPPDVLTVWLRSDTVAGIQAVARSWAMNQS